MSTFQQQGENNILFQIYGNKQNFMKRKTTEIIKFNYETITTTH